MRSLTNMNDPGPPVDSTVMASARSTRPSLSTLPVEMLDKIFWLVDKPDLVNLRLVSKSVCSIANKPFAVRNFTSCHHVITQRSLQTLLEISAHSVFGACIKKIMVNTARAILEYIHPYDEGDQGTVVDDSFVESGRFSCMMNQILVNVKQHSGSITIGIDESSCFGHGSRDQHFYSRRTPRQKYYGARELRANGLGVVCRTPETLELVIAEIRAAGIDTNGLEINLAHHSHPGDNARVRLHKSTAGFLKSRDSPIDLCFTWIYNGALEYNHLHSRLYLSSSSLLTTREHHHPDGRFVEETVQLLADTSFSDLCLRKLKVDYLPYLDVYFTRFLQTVTLDDIKLGSELFAQGLYSNLFQRLSEIPSLKHCRFYRLHYSMSFVDDSNRMKLISGNYPSNWTSLLLIFPDGKFEVEIQGSHISEELENLAAYTAAAEKRKVQEIQAAGKLVEHRVMGADTPIFEEEDDDYPMSFRSSEIII
ncbi:hypothetical protein E4T52_05531 [Aureobasidium sp. EXF-3400]|nr:hypothetical protein E4T51_14988 [Aureobasidium sp. EXF-12344]KAI4779563.1 hypothetical protein E4T52_05531 [Aureobasidium sp. EXF-3400]